MFSTKNKVTVACFVNLQIYMLSTIKPPNHWLPCADKVRHPHNKSML